MKRMIAVLALAFIGTTLLGGVVFADQEGDGTTKAITVEGGSRAAAGKRLAVDIKAAKSTYAVNERITFVVQANRDAYLYLYSVTPNNKILQIFPNQHESNNKVRANQKVTFPDKAKLSGDRPGKERFLLIATAAKLTMPTRESGEDYFEIDAKEMEGLRKSIVLEGPYGAAPAPAVEKERIQKEFEVLIKGEDAGFIGDETTSAPTRPLVLVTTDKYRYRLNDKVTFGYAADTDGYLKVYQMSPDRKRTLVTEGSVEPGKVYRWDGRAAAPAGKYALVAVFTKNHSDDDAGNDFIMKSLETVQSSTKGLVPLDTPEIFTVHRFEIE